jgi:2-polyprenyl-3-methyl-5-hydroxy-6-metoxy-1,4-benzoquinol methylase
VTCRACHSPDLAPLPFEVPAAAGVWHRCRACGSDTAAHAYDGSIYNVEYMRTHAADAHDPERMREQVLSNCTWFSHHREGVGNTDFLDVGCADGAALHVMQSLGSAVHGFETFAPPYAGPHVTVAPIFHRFLFPNRYGYVLCREVVEHVEHPDFLLHELHGVAAPGGLVQVQTQRPVGAYHRDVYQRAHLCVFSPPQLRRMLAAAMLDVIDAREWETGQAFLTRARR